LPINNRVSVSLLSRYPASKQSRMSVRLQQDQVIDLMSPMVTSSAQTLVVTKEGISVSVSTTLLRIFSKTLSTILDLPPCVSTSIILPDCSLPTLHNIIEILTRGYSQLSRVTVEAEAEAEVIKDIIEVSALLGIDIINVHFGSKSKDNILEKSKQTRNLLRENYSDGSLKTVNNIKEEAQDMNLAFQCTLCNKTFKSPSPLGYHYCKHLYDDLEALDFSELIQDEKCTKCERTFFDKNAMLRHLGVQHGYINQILEAKGLPQLQLEDDNSAMNVNIKTENAEEMERSCELCVQDFSSVPISSLAYHYCNHFANKMQVYFSRFYFDETCKICKKNFKSLDSLMVHIGVRHGKINIILSAEQLKPVRFPKKKKSKTSSEFQTSIFTKEKVLKAFIEPKQESGSNFSSDQLKLSREKLESKTCFICDKTSGSLANLRQHICTHFWNDLKTLSAATSVDGKTCGICKEKSPSATQLIKHIAITHGKLDEILESKGYPTLNKNGKKCPLPQNKAPRRNSTSDIKEIRECEICNKEFESLSKLGQHMVTGHFLKEIRETYKNLYNGKECVLCNNAYTRNVFVMHIGATHNKLDEVLTKNGYRPLKAKIVPNFKKITIKKERPDTSEPTNEFSYFEENSQQEVSVEENTHAVDLENEITPNDD